MLICARPRAIRCRSRFSSSIATVDPLAPADESAAIDAARLFTAYLQACRKEHQTLSMVGPGRFLMPGDLAGSPALTFAPLALPADGEPPAGLELGDDARGATTPIATPWCGRSSATTSRASTARSFWSTCFRRSMAGRRRCAILQDALTAVLDCFQVGRGGWLSALFRPRADRILFAATKADQIHHSAHDRLEAILQAA